MKTQVAAALFFAVGLTACSPQDTNRGAINYRGKGVSVVITSEARIALESFGYSFPLVDGVMSWCLNSRECATLDVEEGDAHTSLTLNITEADVNGKEVILVCRTYTLRSGESRQTFHEFQPHARNAPFTPLLPTDEVKVGCQTAMLRLL